MAASSKTRVWIWVGVAVWVVLIAVLLVSPAYVFGWALLVSTLLIALGWVAIELGYKKWRRKRQNAFDENLAAREGVDDRRREWSTWTDELNRQGIDRYQLPFYLLVGEPQGGKSILLHNSELHFPFGQSRLSGLGGTRGCDWWFTEEAVILDVAGRLFTHEGGASDAAEWEAFLDLLVGYRPLSPANGILLVLPCDSLLEDSAETTNDKARRIQDTLLTLANKLQAQIPVYVVLTKADKIFGFAECVHRLDAKRRLEMFGWSRPAGLVDSPFSQPEVQDGFEGIVQRARVLRSNMVATAQIPEALGEVDRLYAFPDELAALWPAIDRYLTQIFTESSLVDRLYFRGLYLTSGLQSGAPIAKACAELVGGGTESDQRDLEAIFTQQRAYFIRDLIKKRVFGERGLVRPTDRRLKAARTRQWIAYGVAGFLTLMSVVGATWYLIRGRGDALVDEYTSAIETTHVSDVVTYVPGRVGDESSRRLGTIHGALASLDAALGQKTPIIERFFGGARGKFDELFSTVFDERYVPLVRLMAETELEEASKSKPASAEELTARVVEATTLLGPISLEPTAADKNDIDGWRTLVGAAGFNWEPSEGQDGDAGSRRDPFQLRDRRVLAEEEMVPSLPDRDGRGRSEPLNVAVANIEQQLEGVLDPTEPQLAAGSVGFFAAWQETSELYRTISFDSSDPTDRTLQTSEFLEACRGYGAAASALEQRLSLHPQTTSSDDQNPVRFLDTRLLQDEFVELRNMRGLFHRSLGRVAEGSELEWAPAKNLAQFAKDQLQEAEGSPGVNLDLGRLVSRVSHATLSDLNPRNLLRLGFGAKRSGGDAESNDESRFRISTRRIEREYLDRALLELARPEHLDSGARNPQALLAELKEHAELARLETGTDALRRTRHNVLVATAYEAGNDFIREYSDWESLKLAVQGPEFQGAVPFATSDYCEDLKAVLIRIDARNLAVWISILDARIADFKREYEAYQKRKRTESGENPLQFTEDGSIPWGEVQAIGEDLKPEDRRAERLRQLFALLGSSSLVDIASVRPRDGAYTKTRLEQLGDDHASLERYADEVTVERMAPGSDLEGYGRYLELRDGQLVSRLEGHRRALESTWGETPRIVGSSLPIAASRTLQEISLDGIQGLRGKLLDHGAPADLQAAQGALEFLPRSAAYHSVELRPFMGRTYEPDALFSSEAATRLRTYAGRLSGVEAKDRRAILEAYAESRPPEGADAIAGPWEKRVAKLHADLDARVLEYLARAFLADVREEILETETWDDVATVIDWTRGAPWSAAEGDLQVHLRRSLVGLFDPNGLLAQVKLSSEWESSWGGAEDAPLGDEIARWVEDHKNELDSDARDAWSLFQFMDAFEQFLGPRVELDEAQGLGPWHSALRFRVLRNPGESSSVWNAANEVQQNYFSFSSTGASQGKWSMGETLNKVKSFTIDPWSFKEDSDLGKNRRLGLRWANDGTDKRVSGDKPLFFRSALAPALLVWNHAVDTGQDSGPRKVWRVRIPVLLNQRDATDTTQYYADFEVEFDRPLPNRPLFAH